MDAAAVVVRMFDVKTINPNNVAVGWTYFEHLLFGYLFIPPAQLKETSDENYRRISIEDKNYIIMEHPNTACLQSAYYNDIVMKTTRCAARMSRYLQLDSVWFNAQNVSCTNINIILYYFYCSYKLNTHTHIHIHIIIIGV